MWPQASHLIFLGLSVFYHEIKVLHSFLKPPSRTMVFDPVEQGNTFTQTLGEGQGPGRGKDEAVCSFPGIPFPIFLAQWAATFPLQSFSTHQTSKSIKKDTV